MNASAKVMNAALDAVYGAMAPTPTQEQAMDTYAHVLPDAPSPSDAREIAEKALEIARKEGRPSTTLVGQIFGQREKYQALSLLICAARTLLAAPDSPEDDMLGWTDKVLRAHPDDFQSIAEHWEAIREVADREADEAWRDHHG